jgi:CspA family cold shock protein|tara:strand:- start:125 stop:421 length:297 start_codon:yes stop_codon:yes gene_type:complete
VLNFSATVAAIVWYTQRRTQATQQSKETGMPQGTVKWFNATKGFGFIEPSDGTRDAFVHISSVEKAGLATLNEGQKVEFELVPGRDGKSAAENLVLLD